eukprot:scaffold63054_cov60-Phaeocystis_antarctica.AAC.2
MWSAGGAVQGQVRVASGRRRVTPAGLDTDVEDAFGRGRQLLADVAGEGRDEQGHAQPPASPAEEQVAVAAQYQAHGHERRLLRSLLCHLRASEWVERAEMWRPTEHRVLEGDRLDAATVELVKVTGEDAHGRRDGLELLPRLLLPP